MPRINVQKLKKKDVVMKGNKECVVTSLAWDIFNNRVTILGTNGLAESVSLDSNITIK